jgi:hypothetical protein
MREMRNACKFLVSNPERKRRSRRLEENVHMDLKETGYEAMDSIQLADDRDNGGML